jgi:hypothetical protein
MSRRDFVSQFRLRSLELRLARPSRRHGDVAHGDIRKCRPGGGLPPIDARRHAMSRRNTIAARAKPTSPISPRIALAPRPTPDRRHVTSKPLRSPCSIVSVGANCALAQLARRLKTEHRKRCKPKTPAALELPMNRTNPLHGTQMSLTCQ